MQKLEDFEVRTETSSSLIANHGNAIPVLHEILHVLKGLHARGETATIDLHSMPFGPGDEARLLSILGRGEIEVRLDSLGASEIWESGFPGVWIIEHKNSADERIALQIEVTRVPDILLSPLADISESISRLEDQLMTEPAGRAGAVCAGGDK